MRLRPWHVLALLACAPVAAAPPAASLEITNLAAGRFELHNATKAPIRLASTATLERQTAAGWVAIPTERLDLGNGYRLVEACASARPSGPAACVDLAAGASLVPVPWSGLNCSAQCNLSCRGNAREPDGAYRLVVHACDSSASIAGPTFQIGGTAPWDRAGIVEGITAATAVRADLPAKDYAPDAPASADRVAGLVTRAGTEHALDATELAALVAMLHDDKGLDLDIIDRCKSGRHVALRLTRSLATTAATARTDAVELSVDFTCNRVFAVYGGGAGGARTSMVAGLGKQRAAWLAAARGWFPKDAELAKR